MDKKTPSSGFQPPSPVEGEGKIKQLAKVLRKNQQEPELILWQYLRNRRLKGYKFRRQVSIDKYIADFVCYEARLIIELDGRQHLNSENLKQDAERTKYLESQNFRIVRFYNTDIFNNIDVVLEKLYQELDNSSFVFQPVFQDEVGEQDFLLPRREKVAESRMRVLESNKQQLRKWAKEERKRLDIDALSQKLVEKLQKTEEYIQAKNVMVFYPLKDEINLLELIKDETKNFYLPKIDGENLSCCPYKETDELCESCFKTKEPSTEPVQNDLIDLVIVPALAVDKNNYRLGYGGGFYDRFLSRTNVKKIVCIPQALVVKTVFPEEHDIKMDKVIWA